MGKDNLEEYDKLEIGVPEYINLDDIKTTGIVSDRNKKYSQLRVKNLSDKNMYDVNINLHGNKSKLYSSEHDSYSIEVLEPNEEVIISIMHWYPTETLKVDNYNYQLEDESVVYIKDNKVEKEKITKENKFYTETNKLNNNIDTIQILESKITEKEKYRTNMEVKVKNVGNSELEGISLDFKELYNDDFIGINNHSSIINEDSLKPGQEAIINVRYNNDAELELLGYKYNIKDENLEDKNINSYYSVYPELGVYRYYEYNDSIVGNFDIEINKLNSITIIWIVFLIMIIISRTRYLISKKAKKTKRKY